MSSDERRRARKPCAAPWRRLQFTVRDLLLLMLLVAIAGSYLVSVRMRFQEQARAVREIERLGGSVSTTPRGNRFLRYVIGPDIYFDVDVVDVELRTDICAPAPQMVGCLARLFTLKSLWAEGYPLCDEDVFRLRGLTNLRLLELDRTNVTDECLKHLGAMANLEYLLLNKTRVTDQGLRNLPELPALKTLQLGFTGVTGAGILCLADKLPRLEELLLLETQISNNRSPSTFESLNAVKKRLPHLRIGSSYGNDE